MVTGYKVWVSRFWNSRGHVRVQCKRFALDEMASFGEFVRGGFDVKVKEVWA